MVVIQPIRRTNISRWNFCLWQKIDKRPVIVTHKKMIWCSHLILNPSWTILAEAFGPLRWSYVYPLPRLVGQRGPWRDVMSILKVLRWCLVMWAICVFIHDWIMTCSHKGEAPHLRWERKCLKRVVLLQKGALALVTIKRRLKVKTFVKPRGMRLETKRLLSLWDQAISLFLNVFDPPRIRVQHVRCRELKMCEQLRVYRCKLMLFDSRIYIAKPK